MPESPGFQVYGSQRRGFAEKAERVSDGEYELCVVWVRGAIKCWGGGKMGKVWKIGSAWAPFLQPIRWRVPRRYPLHQNFFPRCSHWDQDQGISPFVFQIYSSVGRNFKFYSHGFLGFCLILQWSLFCCPSVFFHIFYVWNFSFMF